MAPVTRLERYCDLIDDGHPRWLTSGLDEVFFQSSNTQAFVSEEEKELFRERWLGRYLTHDPQWTYVALDSAPSVAGYLVGALDDPALASRFADIGYFQAFAGLTARFPAHLHINLAPEHRGRGVGAQLLERFFADAAAAGCPGVHVVTSRGARNVAFYNRHGLHEEGASRTANGEIVFLARQF